MSDTAKPLYKKINLDSNLQMIDPKYHQNNNEFFSDFVLKRKKLLDWVNQDKVKAERIIYNTSKFS